ncbi:lycopene cyclase domain-containing protein [Microbacterium indicum]|uniref:lycopene cyclase domain-containing protein n=1 Tax=Microbacterium indicum TaxID=358100 RepID=UPI00042727B0|nr:lycopene cyclase domain-containing protein [Microbacterium indicum]
MSLIYLGALFVCLACVVAVDVRFRLFFGRDWRRALIVLAAGLVFFLAWDLAGIGLGIFLRGDGPFVTGVMLAPELPLEEPVFLVFLCEVTMVLVLGAQRLVRPRKGSDS